MMLILGAAFVTAFDISHAASLREQRFSLSIKKGPLVSVLEQFSKQTGLHIGTEVSALEHRNKRFGPFVGEATADEAIKALLKRSDLWYGWREEDTIRLFQISAQRTNWISGRSTVKEASDSIRGLAGVRYKIGSCGKRPVGPFESSEPITAEAFWVELIKPYCEVIRMPSADIEPGSIDSATIAGETEQSFFIPALSRLRALQRLSEQAGILVDYVSTGIEEEQALVEPISGSMTVNEALQLAIEGSALRIRWIAEERVIVEPAYLMVAYADMSKCACNFGLPELSPVRGDHVTVEGRRIASLQKNSHVPVTVLDRRKIDSTGASSIPELLNMLAEQAFSRPRGFRSNAAQYFEGRGFGAAYSLILINGHRAYGSAADPMTNAFDLNAVPLSAVEEVQISLDQPSILYGTDAFGGTVNIELKEDLEKDAATVVLGSASGGAQKNRATLMVDDHWSGWNVGVVLDHLSRGELLGSARDRWRNQNYTTHQRDAQDYRLPGALPNVYATSGHLPGYNVSSGAFQSDASGLTFQPNMTNMESALAHTGIEPKQERKNVYGFANTELGNAQLSLGVLYGEQSVSLRAYPVSVPGLVWGKDHFQNPFGRNVLIEAMLTGLPSRMHRAESNLTRVMADFTHSFSSWEYSAFAVAQRDRSRTWLANDVDLAVLAQSLSGAPGTVPLNVLSQRPGSGPVPPQLLSEPLVHPYETAALQMGLTVSARPMTLPAGDLKVDLGAEYRQEAARFDTAVGRLDREVKSTFSYVRVPLLGASTSSLDRSLELAVGARRDFYSDVRYVSTWQAGLTWQPVSAIKVHAGYSTLFRPPSLYELYLPTFSFPFELFDPQRGEVAAISFMTGGNPLLKPTEGESVDLGISLHTADGWDASLKYWQTRMGNRVSPVLAPDLLNAHDDVAGRVIRADGGDEGRPGRILTLDTRFGNFGAVSARGFDISIARAVDTPIGLITPGIDITRTVDFEYRDLPAASAALLDRAGIASVYGTVPSGRFVAYLHFARENRLRLSTFARYHSSYKDYSSVAGAVTGRRVPAQTLLDIKVTKDIGDHLTLSVGANNVLDDSPPFAQSGGWEGFDQSQGNLLGREAFFEITGSF